jgi:hypothetical protein
MVAMRKKKASVEDVLARVLERFTYQGTLFTALDVSNAVKETLPNIRHREVSPLVRQAFEGGEFEPYKATPIDVNANGQKVQALLYHLPSHDPSQYDDAMRSQLAKPRMHAPDGQSSDAQILDDTPSASVPVGADGRGRVSRRLLANSGIEGDEVRVVVKSAYPPSIEIWAGDDADEDEDDEDDEDDEGGEEVEADPSIPSPPAPPKEERPEGEDVSCFHPDLLYLSPKQLEIFSSGTSLAARVEGNKVVIAALSYSTPADYAMMPMPVSWT